MLKFPYKRMTIRQAGQADGAAGLPSNSSYEPGPFEQTTAKMKEFA